MIRTLLLFMEKFTTIRFTILFLTLLSRTHKNYNKMNHSEDKLSPSIKNSKCLMKNELIEFENKEELTLFLDLECFLYKVLG